MVSYPSINLVDSIIDEVALEGLDGITIEALWLRLSYRLHNTLPFPKPFMEQMWSICVQIREFAFYELEVARGPFVIFDRYQYVDPDLGIILEPENVPPDIYPHCPIHDISNGIKGSCSTYYTRKQITELVRGFSLDEAVEKYGQKLVIVASQSARNHALMGDEIPPTLELNVTQYCFLERVGRSRYHGEVTQGKLSLNALKEDPKSLFYHRKFLLRHKLITKQIHHQKSGGHCFNGSLLHLPRFFVERKPKIIFLAEEVIKILKSKPNCVAEYDEIKRELQIERAIKKLFKTSFFQKVVKTDIRVPYRTLYPNAKPTEWRLKNTPSKEKRIKVVQLLSPNIDIFEAWNKDETQEDEEPEELNISNHKYSVPYLKQANRIIEASGNDGVCQGGLARIMGLTKLQSRTVLRNLVKTNIVATYMNDFGRQRLTKYVSKKYEKGSKLSKEFKKEMHKIKAFTKQMKTETDDLKKNKMSAEVIVEPEKNTDISNKKETVQEVSKCKDDTEFIVETEEKSNTSAEELQKVFYVVNRILYKYRIIKRPNKYKRTFSNYLTSTAKRVKIKEKDINSDQMPLQESNGNERAATAYKNIRVDLSILKASNTDKSENEIFGFMEDVQNSEKKNVTNITYRLLKRANLIIESVKQHQVIDDMTKLMKMIHEEEDKEGYDVKIDKKSLIRLLQKLAKDNLIKNIRLVLSGNGREKNLTFICDPNIDINSAVIQSAVEQAKLKFYLLGYHRSKSSMKRSIEESEASRNTNADDGTDKFENKSPLDLSMMLPQSCKHASKMSRQYGYSPKFLRMQALHIFLFYVVYEHIGEQTRSKSEQIQALRNNGFNVPEELIEEFGTIYTNDVSWKMFIPPLPKYTGWPVGWTLMCDILLRLPLSIFLKIHYVSCVVPEVEKYINHPIRKHYLVRDLPIDIRNSLLYARKYIFNIHETVKRLCYVGLIQFGPQKLKEKDQVFIYVNRVSELMDTTSSGPSYHMVQDKSYPVIKYNFTEIQVVEKYWYDMWNICINTPLGGRLVVQGKDIVLEDLNKKSDMIQAVTARSPEEAKKLDVGRVPGDRKGAAGIDSAFFAHLKRNWNWAITNLTSQMKNKQNEVYERDKYLSEIKVKPLKFTEFSGFKTVCGPPSVSAIELKKKTESKIDESSIQQKKYEALTCQRSAKQKSYVRRVLPRKCSSKRRTKYDEIDYRALQRMHKLRVDWDPYEDKILLVCKIVMTYLCPNPRKQVITFSAVRDVLRTYSFTSYNKTSRACQRRLLYMLRQQRNVDAIALGVEELKQNFFIRKRFDGITEKLKEEHKSPHDYEKQVTEAFKYLVAYTAKKYYDISDVGSKEPLPVPSTVQEFNLFYKVVHPTKPFSNRGFTKDVHNINDIHFVVINSVIHSSMCCGKDRRSWAYQLFKVYQQYPEMLLRNAMAKIRSDQMVSIRKNHLTALRKYGNYMPMSSSQYQLSSNYMYKLQTKWPYDLFKESYDVFIKLSNWYCKNQSEESSSFNGIEVLPVTGGLIGLIHDYVASNQIDFDIEIPDQVIMLDPRLQEKDETYFRIAKRYQDVLVSLDNLKFVKEFRKINVKLDKGGSTNSNVEKNVPSQEHEGKKKNVEDAKHFPDHDDLNFDSGEESGRNVADDEQDTIKLQDGTKIVLNKDDVQRSVLGDDDSMMGVDDKATDSTNQIPKSEDTSQKKEKQLSKHRNTQGKLITSGKKRPRDGSKQIFDADEPTQKLVKLSNEKDKNSIELQSNNVTEVPSEVQNENLGKHSNDKFVETTDTKLNTNDADSEIKKCEVSVQSKKKGEHTYTRVSDILKNVPLEQSSLSSYCKIDDSADKRYTRIALLRMREELSELSVADSHHAHEYFVVNMFKVLYNLCTPSSGNPQENIIFRGLSLPKDLVPLSLNVANDLIQEINKFAIFPKDGVSYSDFKKKLSKDCSLNLNDIDMVYKFIRDKKEIGASIQELTNKFESSLGGNLPRIAALLTKHRIVLRFGVTTVRYIHYRHADAWLIHSYKIYRLEKESLMPIPKGTVYLTETKEAVTENNDVIMTEVCEKNSNLSSENELLQIVDKSEIDNKLEVNEEFDKDTSNHSDEDCTVQVKRRMQRKRTLLLPQKDISRAAKQLDLNTKQEVRVVIKPWIQIDGALNRRVLDRMLGSILSYCLTHPGIALSKLQTRFLPVLQPCHTRELTEMLIKLGCVEKMILKKPRITLFSKPSQVKPKITNDDWAPEEEIFFEPTNEAILKFGVFLSTKMYQTDFIP